MIFDPKDSKKEGNDLQLLVERAKDVEPRTSITSPLNQSSQLNS